MAMQTIFVNDVTNGFQKLGNSIKWSFSVETAAATGKFVVEATNGVKFLKKEVEYGTFVGVVTGYEPKMFVLQQPRDEVRSYLWNHGFGKKNIVTFEEMAATVTDMKEWATHIYPDSCDYAYPVESSNGHAQLLIYTTTGGRTYWYVAVDAHAQGGEVKELIEGSYTRHGYYGLRRSEWKYAINQEIEDEF